VSASAGRGPDLTGRDLPLIHRRQAAVGPRSEGPRECLVTNHSAEYFLKLTDETEAAALDALAGRTLADSLDELRAIDQASGAPTWPGS
jgi:hypothetical protein